MHYRNGREAKSGDRIVKFGGGYTASGEKCPEIIVAVGVLYGATPGNDYCNGNIAPTQSPNEGACMVDCLHVDDLAAVLAEKGLASRPAGK